MTTGCSATASCRCSVDTTTGELAGAVTTGAALPVGTELLGGGVRPIVIADDSDTWSHGLDRYAGDEEPGWLISVGIVEAGPVRATVRSVWSFGGGRTTVTQDVSLYEGRCLAEVRLGVDWHEAHRVLKLVVPVALGEPTSTAGAAYGSVERPCSGHEEPMVHWVDLSDPGAGWGLACTAEGAGGYDALGPTLRLTVLRSPRVADHGLGWGSDDPAGYPVTDQGRHEVRYRLVPHLGTRTGGAAAPVGRGAPGGAPGGARHLAPGTARARGVGGGDRGRGGDHPRPQARRGRGRHGRPPVGGRRPAGARPPVRRGRGWAAPLGVGG